MPTTTTNRERERNLRRRLSDGLVGDDEILKEIAGLLSSLDELGSKKNIGNFSALAHDSQPGRKLRVILGKGNRGIISLITNSLHIVLVDNSPDKAIISRLLNLELIGARNRRHSLRLLAIEGIQSSIDSVLRNRSRFEERPKDKLSNTKNGVKSLLHDQVDIDKGHVLATRSIRLELEERLLPNLALAAEPDLGELATQHGQVLRHKVLGLGSVPPRADEVEDEEHGDDAEDVALEAELAEGVALVHVVPFRVGLACGGGLETVGGAWGKGGGVFGDDWGVTKVCEVCVSSGDALAYVNIYKPGILRCLEAPLKHGACPFGLSRRCVGAVGSS